MKTDDRPLVLGIDPGLANGVALIQRDPMECLHLGEYDWKDAVRYIAETLRDHPQQVAVVVERFLITQQTAKNSQAPWSLEMIGMVRLMCWQYGAGEMIMQTPGDAQAFLDNTRLRELGWWKRGSKDHCRMAAKHAGLYMLRTGCRNPALLGTLTSA